MSRDTTTASVIADVASVPPDRASSAPPVEFPRDLLPLLRCSRDAGMLDVEEICAGPAGVTEANLRCRTCPAEYRIEHGIARLMDGALSAENEHEISLRDEEYAGAPEESYVPPEYGWRSEFSDRIEVPPHLNALGSVENCTVLEIGCGDGRFTVLMAQMGAQVLAVDFSLSALYKLAQWLAAGKAPTTYRVDARWPAGALSGRVGLVQADAGRLHVAPRSFARALSATPLDGRDERMAMYHTIADALQDDGRFVASLEHDDLSRRMLGLPTARRYSQGGIFIEHFDRAKVRTEAAPYFGTLHIRPIRPRIPLLHRLPLRSSAWLADCISATPWLKNFGEILLIRGGNPVRPPVEDARRRGSVLVKNLYRWYVRKKGQLPVWGSEIV